MQSKHKRLMITGGYGFIGSNFVNMIMKKYKDVKVLIIDKMTYAADENNILLKYQEDKRFNAIFNKDINNIHDEDYTIKSLK